MSRAMGGDAPSLWLADRSELVLTPGKAHRLYRLESGLVRLYTLDDAGLGVTLRFVKRGGVFGEEALTGRPRRYFAEAMAPSVIEALDPASMGDAELRALVTTLAAALDDVGMAMHRTATKQLAPRIAALILELADSDLATRDSDGLPVVRITHHQIAMAAGSVRETATKAIGDLARLGAIYVGYRKVTVRDERLLREAAGDD